MCVCVRALFQVDVTFPRMPCSWLSLDTMDVSGDMHLDVAVDVYKQRLSAAGTPLKEAEKHDVQATKKSNDTALAVPKCGSCYGAEAAEGQCCNTCEEVGVYLGGAQRSLAVGWACTWTLLR